MKSKRDEVERIVQRQLKIHLRKHKKLSLIGPDPGGKKIEILEAIKQVVEGKGKNEQS